MQIYICENEIFKYIYIYLYAKKINFFPSDFLKQESSAYKYIIDKIYKDEKTLINKHR
jgi:hypothetical protein